MRSREYQKLKYIHQIKEEFCTGRCQICGFSNCTMDAHHIKPVKDDGETTIDNLIFVCPNCHRLIHTGKIEVFNHATYAIVANIKNPKYPRIGLRRLKFNTKWQQSSGFNQ